jgi:hypothetical protein
MVYVHVDAFVKWGRCNTILSKMFRAAKISTSSFELPAKTLICVELRLDLALLEDVLEGQSLRCFWRNMAAFQKSVTVFRMSVAALGWHNCA